MYWRITLQHPQKKANKKPSPLLHPLEVAKLDLKIEGLSCIIVSVALAGFTPVFVGVFVTSTLLMMVLPTLS